MWLFTIKIKNLVWWNYCGSSVWPCVPWIWSAECISSFQFRSLHGQKNYASPWRHGDLQQSLLLLLQVIDTPHARAGWRGAASGSGPGTWFAVSSAAATWTTCWKSLFMLSFFDYDLWYYDTWIRPSFYFYRYVYRGTKGTPKPLSGSKEWQGVLNCIL